VKAPASRFSNLQWPFKLAKAAANYWYAVDFTILVFQQFHFAFPALRVEVNGALAMFTEL